MKLAIRMPDHLGDATMALAALRSLLDRHPGATVHGPRLLADLLAATSMPASTLRPGNEVPDADVGVLLKPSFHAAWRWRHLPRRVGLAANGRALLLTDPVPARPDEHRRDAYGRVARAALALAEPTASRAAGDPRSVGHPTQPTGGFIALNPWSPTPTVRWPHFRALAEALARDHEVRFYAGPGEEAHVRAIAGPHPLVAGLSLPDFALNLAGAALFVTNDSGAGHFADAVGVPVLMIHGSTNPALTGTGEAITGGPIWCGPCYRKTCVLGLGCLTRIGPDVVAARVRAMLAADAQKCALAPGP